MTSGFKIREESPGQAGKTADVDTVKEDESCDHPVAQLAKTLSRMSDAHWCKAQVCPLR